MLHHETGSTLFLVGLTPAGPGLFSRFDASIILDLGMLIDPLVNVIDVSPRVHRTSLCCPVTYSLTT